MNHYITVLEFVMICIDSSIDSDLFALRMLIAKASALALKTVAPAAETSTLTVSMWVKSRNLV